MTSHFEESTMTGMREISGSDASRLRKCLMACFESSSPSSMFTSRICAPPSTCLAGHFQRGLVVVFLDETGEPP